MLARSGVRIGEFGARVLPATGKLISDAIQKGPFKIKETGNNYVQDYTDVLPSNIKGTGIFSEFLENITPTSLEKKVGLDKLIKKKKKNKKQIKRSRFNCWSKSFCRHDRSWSRGHCSNIPGP